MMEDGFDGRDATGLQPGSERTEAQARAFYFRLYGKLVLCKRPGSDGRCTSAPSSRRRARRAFRFPTHTNRLGWVFASRVYLMRIYLAINANGARAPARVDRPDQHVYRLMSPDSDKQPYVMMVTTGEVGRFNRAQRACYNTDESMSVFLTGLLLGALMFGPFATLLAVVNLYGRCRFADLYTHSVGARRGLPPERRLGARLGRARRHLRHQVHRPRGVAVFKRLTPVLFFFALSPGAVCEAKHTTPGFPLSPVSLVLYR